MSAGSRYRRGLRRPAAPQNGSIRSRSSRGMSRSWCGPLARYASAPSGRRTYWATCPIAWIRPPAAHRRPLPQADYPIHEPRHRAPPADSLENHSREQSFQTTWAQSDGSLRCKSASAFRERRTLAVEPQTRRYPNGSITMRQDRIARIEHRRRKDPFFPRNSW